MSKMQEQKRFLHEEFLISSQVLCLIHTSCTFETVSAFLRWRCREPCAFTWIIKIKYFNSVLKPAIQPSSRSHENLILVIRMNHQIPDLLVCRRVKG